MWSVVSWILTLALFLAYCEPWIGHSASLCLRFFTQRRAEIRPFQLSHPMITHWRAPSRLSGPHRHCATQNLHNARSYPYANCVIKVLIFNRERVQSLCTQLGHRSLEAGKSYTSQVDFIKIQDQCHMICNCQFLSSKEFRIGWGQVNVQLMNKGKAEILKGSCLGVIKTFPKKH